MLPPPLIPDNSNGKRMFWSFCPLEIGVIFPSQNFQIQFPFLRIKCSLISEVSCSCFKPLCSCLLPRNGAQQSNNYYAENVSQTPYLPTTNENYWIPNRLNQSTTFNYSDNHNEPEFISFEHSKDTEIYKFSPLSGEAFQPDEIFQLDQPIRYSNNAFNASSPQTLLDLGSGTIETKINTSIHGFNGVSDSFYNLNEDSTSSSQNNDNSICSYPNYHMSNNNNVIGSNRDDPGNSLEILGLNNCDGTGNEHTVEMPRLENNFHIQYEHQSLNFKTQRGNDMVVDNCYRKSFGLYDENQTFMSSSNEQALTVLNEKINQQTNTSDLSLCYQQQFLEPTFNYPSNNIDSNMTYKISLDSGQ